jgi:serine/threonine protein kinase
MPLGPGSRIGHCEIVALIGQGGMGEVYRARDAKLLREVAIKVLPEQFASDTGRLARFEREARALAALNHSNIAQIFGFEQAPGVQAFVMELVDGRTLDDIIAVERARSENGLPLRRALTLAAQVAAAEERAMKPLEVTLNWPALLDPR